MKHPLAILVVEDLQLAQQVAVTIFTALDYEVVVKNSGASALDHIITSHRYSVTRFRPA
jgi:CheY-like chemotaxis protein